MPASIASPRLGRNLDALMTAKAPLLFGLRLWVSVCLALFVAFRLELDNPYWAGATAAIVSQPQLGAALRKGWFRMIGSVTGAVAIVVLTACFPQDRIAYFGFLALWGGLCAFAATELRNFASYGAALAGYTAAIVAAGNLGATGGASPDVFLLALWRASEICIGIACASIVLAGTYLPAAKRRLAASFADLVAEIAARFTLMLELPGARAPDTQSERREFLRQVIALDQNVDQTLGESSHVRYYAATLEAAFRGFFRALDGWRGVATHLGRLPDHGGEDAQTILRQIPPSLRSARVQGARRGWMTDPMALRRACEHMAEALLALPAGTTSLRLLADETARVMAGLANVLDGLALLVDAPDRMLRSDRSFRLGVADWLPSIINGARAFVVIGAVTLFWIVTAWPNGGLAMVFAMVPVLVLAPRGDVAYGGAIATAIGAIWATLCAAIAKFALLPAVDTFPGFCVVLGLFLIPLGFAIALCRQPFGLAIFSTMSAIFLPVLAPTNVMIYDTAEFYNSSLATIAGSGVAALSFALLPPLSPAVRTRRLLALALRDLRRLAEGHWLPTIEDWEDRLFGRLAALPEQAEPLQRARLLAAQSVGTEIVQTRRIADQLGVAAQLNGAFAAFASGNSAIAIDRLRLIDRDLVSEGDRGPPAATVLRMRSRILLVCEALSEHAAYFDEEQAHAAG